MEQAAKITSDEQVHDGLVVLTFYDRQRPGEWFGGVWAISDCQGERGMAAAGREAATQHPPPMRRVVCRVRRRAFCDGITALSHV